MDHKSQHHRTFKKPAQLEGLPPGTKVSLKHHVMFILKNGYREMAGESGMCSCVFPTAAGFFCGEGT